MYQMHHYILIYFDFSNKITLKYRFRVVTLFQTQNLYNCSNFECQDFKLNLNYEIGTNHILLFTENRNLLTTVAGRKLSS
jgi:hypothetical protein